MKGALQQAYYFSNFNKRTRTAVSVDYWQGLQGEDVVYQWTIFRNTVR